MASVLSDHEEIQKKTRNRNPRKRLTPQQEQQVLANLGEVDNTLLMRLYDLRYLRTDQVNALVYPKKPKTYVWQRLNELHNRGLIGNLKIREGRSTIALWHLAKLGLEATEDMLGVPPEDRLPPKEHKVSAKYARHFVEAADVFVDLSKEMKGIDAWEWLNHRQRYQYGAEEIPAKRGGGQKPLWLIPDATIRLDYGRTVAGRWTREGTWTIYLEVDRSTMKLATMGEKFDKYLALLGRDTAPLPWTGRADVDRYILVLCPSQQRATNLQALLDERKLPGRAVPKEQAVKMLTGELASWWGGVVQEIKDREKAAKEQAERQRRAEEVAAEEWVTYQDGLAKWEWACDAWAQQQFDRQVFKSNDVGHFKVLYAQRVAPAPVPPASTRPGGNALAAARDRLARK